MSGHLLLMFNHIKNKMLIKPNKPAIAILIGCLSGLLILFAAIRLFGIIFTYTGSVPIGFYRIITLDPSIKSGDYISFCLPNAAAQMGISRGYIKSGFCPNGSEALIKEVIAVPGDQVTVKNNIMSINNTRATVNYITPIATLDKDGLPVYRFIKDGTYNSTGYWVYGFGSPQYSWDSRYYGEIPRKNITHRLLPFLVF